jgi:preprotein translocase subunit SecE
MAMAVAEAEKVDKVEKAKAAGDGGSGGALGGALGWPARKLAEARSFLSEVRTELRKVTWPSRKEVYQTTLVVIATSIFFGFYLWALDLGFSRVLSLVLKR